MSEKGIFRLRFFSHFFMVESKLYGKISFRFSTNGCCQAKTIQVEEVLKSEERRVMRPLKCLIIPNFKDMWQKKQIKTGEKNKEKRT